ncbi:Similarity with UbiE/COQ5 methyltransferase [Mycobacteroides abscessus]|nr:Similarity with UbiE/COQ5 methyltransferase [Mycobacteroides abscessus]
MLHHPTLADSLIDPARIDHPPRRDHGYLDVLGPESDEPVSVANRFMQSPLLAAIYERAWRPMFTRGFSYGGKSTLKAHTALMNEIAGRGDHKILDVACGPGLYTRELAAQLGTAGVCIGLDLSGPMLRRACATTRRNGSTTSAVARTRCPSPTPPSTRWCASPRCI